MKIIRKTALIMVLVLSLVLITGCSFGKSEKLFSDLSADDISEIELAKMAYTKSITDTNEIKQFVDYIQGAAVLETETVGASDGWTYAFKVTLKNGDWNRYTISESGLRRSVDDDNQTVYTVETDYFKPLIAAIESEIQ